MTSESIKIVVNNKKLITALQSVLYTPGSVFVFLKEKQLYVFSIYENIKICYRIDVLQHSVENMKAVCIDAIKLYKYVFSMSNETIEINFDSNVMSIKESNLSLRMNVLADTLSDDMQNNIVFNSKNVHVPFLSVRSINSFLNCLLEIINDTSLCNMIHIALSNDCIEVQATNVYKLMRVRIPNISTCNDVFKISSLVAVTLSKILKNKSLSEAFIYIEREDKQIHLFTNDINISFLESEANMPMFDTINERYSYQHKATVDRSKLIEALKRTELVSKDNDYKNLCILRLFEQQLFISSSSANAFVEEKVTAINEYQSTVRLALNSNMLLVTIDKMLSDNISIYFVDELSPILLETENVSAFVSVLSENIK